MSNFPSTFDFKIAGALLRSAIDIADGCPELAVRRESLLKLIASLLDADSEHWAWIRGRPDNEIVMPGDHLKAIFAHFEVNSATELAALFLRSK